jgi:hypothetical protein
VLLGHRRDKKVVSVFVRFRALSLADDNVFTGLKFLQDLGLNSDEYGASEIRWNSKQEFMIQDYFTANNRFGFCNSGNGQVRMFMSNSHTPSNILFSKALTDTTYVDLMKYSGGGCLGTTASTSDTTGALVVALRLVFGIFGSEFRRPITTSGITTTYGMTSTGTISHRHLSLMEQPPQRIT